MSRRRSRPRATPGRSASAGVATAAGQTQLAERLPVLAIVLLFLVFAWAHLTVTPLARHGSFLNAPDERAHVGYVEAIAVGHRFPVRNDPRFRTYQWHQPPLYYVAAALAYPMGLKAIRAVSVLFAIITLWSIWSAAVRLFPRRPVAVVLAVGFAALLPMRQAVMAAVNNDALLECFFSLVLYAVALLLTKGWAAWRILILGLLLGGALLTKSSGFLLVLPVLLAAWLGARGLPWTRRLAWSLTPIVLAAVLAAPWYIRNARLYGEVLPLRAFHSEFAGTSRSQDWIGQQRLSVDLWTGDLRPDGIMDAWGYSALVANWTARTFFAAYTPPAKEAIGAPVFLPPSAYLVYGAILLAGFVGALWSGLAAFRPSAVTGVLGLAAVLVLGSFVGFAATYFQAQGRYLYPTILPMALAWGAGLDRLLPKKHAWKLSFLVLVVLTLLCGAFAFLYVAPAYEGVYR